LSKNFKLFNKNNEAKLLICFSLLYLYCYTGAFCSSNKDRNYANFFKNAKAIMIDRLLILPSIAQNLAR